MEKKSLTMPRVIMITLCACLPYALSGGIRSNIGMILRAVSDSSGIGYSSVSFAVAACQFMFGFTQPFFGMLALKKGNRTAMITGILMCAAGMLIIPGCGSVPMLLAAFILLGAGMGGISFGIIMSAVTSLLSERSAAAASGLISASAGFGSIVLAPVVQSLLAGSGTRVCLYVLAAAALFLIPVSLVLTQSGGTTQENDIAAQENAGAPASRPAGIKMLPMFREALSVPSYRLLLIAFFTCGFHMAIIEAHLFSQMTGLGLSGETAAYLFSLYGIATMIGSVFSGTMTARFRAKYVAGCEFGARPLIILLFFLLPKTFPVIAGFAVLLGFTGGATVPPVSAMVGKLFGPVRLATLFGLLFVSHQLGSFFSTWIGGITVAATGGYTLIWSLSACLAALASACCFLVKEENASVGPAI